MKTNVSNRIHFQSHHSRESVLFIQQLSIKHCMPGTAHFAVSKTWLFRRLTIKLSLKRPKLIELSLKNLLQSKDLYEIIYSTFHLLPLTMLTFRSKGNNMLWSGMALELNTSPLQCRWQRGKTKRPEFIGLFCWAPRQISQFQVHSNTISGSYILIKMHSLTSYYPQMKMSI